MNSWQTGQEVSPTETEWLFQRCAASGLHLANSAPPPLPELIGSLKLGNVWVFDQLICRQRRTKNELYKIPNIA